MINKEDYINLTNKKIEEKFIKYCNSGHLDIVKYLLTSPDLKEHVDIHACNDGGFQWACLNGHLDIVQYLLTSPELKDHVNIHTAKDYGFQWSGINNHFNIIQYLILDMNIKKTKDIQEYLKEYPNEQIENMFKLRDLNKKLEKELVSDKINNKKMKV